jgi:tetratricopeptide (TPR) repeat protein
LNLEQKQFENILKESSFGNQAMADYHFGRLSILQKICPRYVSDRLYDAFNYLENEDFVEAKQLFNEINNKTLNYSAIIGLSEVYLKENKITDGIQLVKKSINKFVKTPYYSNLIFRLGDLYAIDNQNDPSVNLYNEILYANPNYHFDYLIKTRLSLIEKNKLQTYLIENDSVKLELLIELNDSSCNYNSIPIILGLLESQKNNYNKSLSIFNKTFIVDNLESSFAAFKLSQYMLRNLDFANGRKYAALSLRFKYENPFYSIMKENFEKANSFFINKKI